MSGITYTAGSAQGVVGDAAIDVRYDVLRARYVGTTALLRRASMRFVTQATLAAFTAGPGIDVNLFAGEVNEALAGFVADDSQGSTGGWINLIVPRLYSIIWCRVASGLDSGDGVVTQASATDQGLADSGAYTTEDLGICLLDEDAADNPYGAQNLAPILFGIGAGAA